MKKYIVRWKPKKDGKVVFRSEVMACDVHVAALIGALQGEVVAIEEYVQDLWTPVAEKLVAHLEHCAVRDDWRSLGD